ncbi:MAG: hypothetical protein HQK73_00040 [Desulfamplus sp.]|nr:hypothetical protein [Desulfamplus sp.]
MKRIILKPFVLIIFLLNISVNCAFASDVGEAMEILPESTDFVIKFSSTKNFYEYLDVTENSFMGQTVEDINEIKETLGFNPFNLKELESSGGLDASKPFGIAVSDFKDAADSDSPNMNVIVFLPVKDVDKAVAKIKELVEDDNPDAQFTKTGDMWSWYIEVDSSEPEDLEEEVIEEGTEPKAGEENAQEVDTTAIETKDKVNAASEPVGAETPPMPTYMVNKNGYLFIGANPAEDAKQFFQTIGKNGKLLIESPVFTNVIKKSSPTNDLFLYANLGRVLNSNPEVMKYLSPVAEPNGAAKADNIPANLNYLKDYQGMGIAADLKSSDLKADFVVNIVENSALLNMFKGVTPKRDIILGFKDKPLMLLGIVENIQTYWRMMQETLDKATLESIKKQFATVKTDYNIDVEKDIIQNLGNNFTLGMYDAMSINMANINTVASLEFKESAKMKEVIEKMIAKLPPEQKSMVNKVDINGSEVYMMPAGPVQLYAGFIGNNLAITLGKPMFERAMSAEIENGFMKGFKDKSLQKSLQEDISILFFDVKEAMVAAKNFVPMLMSFSPEVQIMMMPEFQKIIEPFDYISTCSRIDGNSMVGEFVFKTTLDKPFFQGVKEANAKIDILKKSIKK